ncbi:swi snf-related matrix-associated actin-dependent regulator of chromatin subfamily a member 3-like 1 [Diplodia corticola]|uniref:Swi snf-related matrix-associated actin-dependent regulator of chromatin subfamily a member 3-like 1 n=1 Tax=Diplodia corticola TaxID=236234 RepID=A0A1J9RUR9_9PEZI|nr:swi snf-related matrix-associated actin-dependent regulator of chromatin subfamily a member 3-like 1 [Diplodia corticola]OJD32167.1 swi snf-related matrix-associated actin-dependent regulator of chromatin subfamily a member 3-like 1 [Diplodia corticola]
MDATDATDRTHSPSDLAQAEPPPEHPASPLITEPASPRSIVEDPELTLPAQSQPSSRASSQGASSSASNASLPAPPAYNPQALLNPKAAAKRARAQSTHSNDASVEGPTEGAVGMGSLIERMHGVQHREDQPVKKQRRDPADEQAGRSTTFEGSGKGTVLGEYVNDQKQLGEKEAAPLPAPSSVVDLTADDDDVVIVKDTGSYEVCLGKIQDATISVFMIPSPHPTAFQGSVNQWPAFKVSLRRRPAATDQLITVTDPCGRDFARVGITVARGLSYLMDNKLLNLRIDARLDSRKRKPGENAGSGTSAQMPLNIHLFAPRKYAKDIGRYLSHSSRQIWLRDPTINIGSIPYYNPQAIKSTVPRAQPGPSSNQPGYGFVARTVEEIRSDVISMFDSLTKSDDIPSMQQPDIILTRLLAHQAQALHFMTSREAEDAEEKGSLWKSKLRGNGERYYYNIISGQETRNKPPPTRGGILADMMGLGKTLTVLSLIAATMQDALEFSSKMPPQIPGAPLIKCNSKATLLICPVSTVANWQEQVNMHVKSGAMSYYIYHGPNRLDDPKELARYDLVISTYSVVATEHDKATSKKPLALINWFRIVLDEAHMIRSAATKQSVATCALLAQRRWAVTGTPVQNRLDDLGALIKFLRIKPFDDKGGFAQYILTPFKNADPEILPKLRILVDSITLRRLKDRINLPARNDQLVRLNFSPDERRLYDFFAKDTAARMASITAGRDKLAKNQMGHILRAIGRLRMICAHGAELLSNDDMKLTEGLSLDNAIELGDDDDGDKPAISKEQAYDMLHLLRESDMHHCGICDQAIIGSSYAPAANDSSDDESDVKKDTVIGFMTPCYQIVCPACFDEFKRRVKRRAAPDRYMYCPLCDAYVRQSIFPLSQEEADRDEAARQRVRSNPRLAKQLGRYGGPHTKVKVLIENLLESKAWSDAHPDEAPLKSVVFSGWTTYLDLISIALEDKGLRYARLDGTMSRKKRTEALDALRDDRSVHVMLISITAGGLGLNLTSASKAYVMEPQYNPAAEAQAVDRVHRLGQTREVTITRFVMNDSFEERMLELQKKKKDLADLSMNRNAKLDKEEAAKKRLADLRSLFR